ncbi:FCRLA protein, partial [Polypterus senegalus]|nr:FCRLA protein [Polypterus senegalus]
MWKFTNLIANTISPVQHRYIDNTNSIIQSSDQWALHSLRTARLEVISRGPDGQIFEGDKVSLTCQVNGHLVEWTFELWKIREENPNETRKENTFTFSPVTLSHRGRYSCRAKKGDLHSEFSASVQLNVLELFSKPTLTVQPNASVWEMDSVDMSCQSESKVTGTRLTYRFYRENMTVIQGKLENVFRITFAVKNNSGSYWCEVGSEEEKTEKKRSDPVQVTVRAMNVTLEPSPSRSVKEGDPLNLTCIWGGKQSFPSKLTFSFLQNNVTVEHNRESPVLSITWVEKRHGGSYMCATELPRGRKTYSKTIEIEVLKGFPLTTVLVSVGLALFLLLLLLLLFVCGRTRGSTFTEGKKARRKEKKMDVITPNRGAVQIEPLNKEGIMGCSERKHNRQLLLCSQLNQVEQKLLLR